MKKLLSFIISAAMVVTIITPVVAVESDLNIDSALIERGYPQIVLETMSEETKLKIYNEDVIFAGATISYYDENSGTFTDLVIDKDASASPVPLGQISTSDLSLTFTYSILKSSGKLDSVLVTYDYNWLTLPFFRWQDPISVSWDGSIFRMADDSFSKVDKYDGYIIIEGIMFTYTGKVHSSEDGYASASDDGVSWYADLKGYIGVTPYRLYGNGSFELIPKSTTYSGSTTLYGHYIHPTTSAGISVAVSDYGEFTVTGGSGYDERGNQKTISW